MNRIYRGQIELRGEFNHILEGVKHGELRVHYHSRRPHMYTIRLVDCWTLLLFPSGRFRIMGKANFDPVNIVVYLTKCIPHSKVICEPQLQSDTFILTFRKQINLYYYSQHSQYTEYEPEIFPSLRLNLWRPIMVNIFSSGKAVVMGREARQFLDQIYTHIDNYILPSYGF